MCRILSPLYIVDNIIWSLKTQSSTLEVSDVLVHYSLSLFFLAKLPSLTRKILFGFTMTSVHKMRGKRNNRAEVESVPLSELPS